MQGGSLYILTYPICSDPKKTPKNRRPEGHPTRPGRAQGSFGAVRQLVHGRAGGGAGHWGAPSFGSPAELFT